MPGFDQLGFEPGLHFGGFFGDVQRPFLQVGIEHETRYIARAKRVVVRPEPLAIPGQRFLGRLVAHVMIAGHIEQPDLRIQFGRDAMVLGGLLCIARLVDQIARDHHKRRLQPIGGRDHEFEIGRLMLEPSIGGVHSELRVGHLDEGLAGERRRAGQHQRQTRHGKARKREAWKGHGLSR